MQERVNNDGENQEWARDLALFAEDSKFIETQTLASRFDYALKIPFYMTTDSLNNIASKKLELMISRTSQPLRPEATEL